MTAKVMVAVRVAVDPATAFRVFTDDIGAWWIGGPRYGFQPSRRGVMRFEPGVGGRLVETYEDGEVYEVGRVLVWEPGQRLVFQWRGTNFADDQVTEVEVRFRARDGGTRVTVEHRGWEVLPPDHPARHGLDHGPFLRLMGQSWTELLEAAKARAERS